MGRCNDVIARARQKISHRFTVFLSPESARLLFIVGNFRLRVFLALAITLTVVACGGGGGGGGSSSSASPIPASIVVSGTVTAPGGALAFVPKPNLFHMLADSLFPAARASLNGMATVPDGTAVDLVRMDDTGTVVTVVASTTTLGGKYSFDFTQLGIGFSSDLVAQVTSTSSGAKMRAFIGTGGTVDLDPASETAVRVVMDQIAASPGVSLSNFTTQELSDIAAAVNLVVMTKSLTVGSDIETTVATFRSAVSTDANVTAFIAAASADGQSLQGPGDIGNYFPFDQGDTWIYQGTEQNGGQTTNYTDTIQITGTKVVNGVTTTVFHETNPDPANGGPPSDDYQVKDDRGITYYGNNDPTDFLTPQVAAYREYAFPLGLNTSFQPINKSGVNWAQDIDGDGIPETANITATQTISSFETVMVPAGTYNNAAKIVTDLNITVFLSSNGATVSDTTTVTEWYAPNTGLVKSTSVEVTAMQGNVYTTATTEELTQFAPNLSFNSISAGADHSCGVTKAGDAYCWGENGGRLGNGLTADSSKPVAVAGYLKFASVSAGGTHTCGVTTEGAAYCWGNNGSGQLGNNTQTNSTVPVPVSGGLVFMSISAGLFHTCGITTNGAAYCWGSNSDGELGYGTLPSIPNPLGGPPMPAMISTVPVPVSGGLTFTSLSASRIYFAGGSYTCGLVTGGVAYCWGSNLMGALGIGDITLGISSVPVPVSGGLTFISMTTEFGTCGVTPTNSTYCWGGQIDNTGAIVDIAAPTPILNGIEFASLNGKGDHICGIAINGAAYCWGMNSNGQIGNNTTSYYVYTPTVVSGGIQFTAISVGESHTCGLSTDGTGYCWGRNFWGELGNGTTIDSSIPVNVTLLP